MTEKSKKGRLNKHLQPRPCTGCSKQLPLHSRILYVDIREYNESGVLPFITANNQHFIYLFCGAKCMMDFMQKAIKSGSNLGLE